MLALWGVVTCPFIWCIQEYRVKSETRRIGDGMVCLYALNVGTHLLFVLWSAGFVFLSSLYEAALLLAGSLHPAMHSEYTPQ